MAILISAKAIRKGFGTRPLFESLTFVVESGERIGLIGPNGAGKSTLMKILAGQIPADSGELTSQRGLRIGYLSQTPVLDESSTVENLVLAGTRDPHDGDSILVAAECLSKLSLNGEDIVGSLSGGWKKRVALAIELAGEPDLMLLDEPTNHLDIESILWLEDFLRRSPFATITVTHDRQFLQKVSNKILELDRRNKGGLLKVDGDYATYLELKESVLSTQKQEEASLKNKLRRETEWLRRGPKARTTKQQARIQSAEALGDEVKEIEYRNQSRVAGIEFQSFEKKPKRLIEAKAISKSYAGKPIFSAVDVFIGPGSRIGLLGQNGSGKSTLIRVLLGLENPDQGTVFRSDHLKVAYFEQNRETLDPNITLAKTLCPAGDHVIYRGKPTHIRGYLDRFLFSKEQTDVPVGKLSGGEQSRILVAKLMLKEANVLVLDEPTNDLDIETLDVLENCLVDFGGAVLLVTHDRYFLDQVAREILAFHEGKVTSFAGVDQWESWYAGLRKTSTTTLSTDLKINDSGKKKKLSYHDQREYDSMEDRIQKIELKIMELKQRASAPEIQTSSSKLAEIYQEVALEEHKLEKCYERWAELEKAKATLAP